MGIVIWYVRIGIYVDVVTENSPMNAGRFAIRFAIVFDYVDPER